MYAERVLQNNYPLQTRLLQIYIFSIESITRESSLL